MSAVREMELELALKIIREARTAIDEAAVKFTAYPAGPQGEKQVELEYALLAVVESAVNDGLAPLTAIRSLRDTGLHLWAIRRVEQHFGPPCRSCIETDLTDIGSIYLTTAGTEGGITRVNPVEPPDSETPSTRH